MNEKSVVKTVKGAELEALINHNDIVFVDFWASWCAPCKQFASVYEKVATDFPDIIFANVDIEQETELAEMFHIQSIPHLIVLKQRIVIYSESGSMPQSTLKELVQQAIDADVTDIREQLDEES
jgi:thioredoxin 1